MSIKRNIVIKNLASITVKGYTESEGGEVSPFSFGLVCERLSEEEVKAEIDAGEKTLVEFMQGITKSWSGVLDDDNTPVPYSAEELASLFARVPNLAGLTFSAYLKQRGAKEKN